MQRAHTTSPPLAFDTCLAVDTSWTLTIVCARMHAYTRPPYMLPEQVLQLEVRAIEEACRSIDSAYRPKVCVLKMRCFAYIHAVDAYVLVGQ
jgi:hypothetical protein